MEKKQYKEGEKKPLVDSKLPSWFFRLPEKCDTARDFTAPIHFTAKPISDMKEALDAVIHFDREGNIKYRDALLEALRDEIDSFLKK